MAQITYVTKEGLKKLQDELDFLQTVERPRISKAIGEAIEKGDISENAEYDSAKEEQGMVMAKIAMLQESITNCRVIDESMIDTTQVRILTRVKMRNKRNNGIITYQIVSEHEADFRNGKLSVDTPIAKALLGHKVGDHVEVTVPAGKMDFEILEITL